MLQHFNKVFGVSAKAFRAWLTTDQQLSRSKNQLLPKDKEFFEAGGEGVASQPFRFKPGHNPRSVEVLSKSASAETIANQLHNDIQNRLYAHLIKKLGVASVGTEIETGSGTAIDVVTRTNSKTTFFEIKTSTSVRTNIRQAIPQLLEYTFWPDRKRADELVVVSQLPITADAKRYLGHLRYRFRLPIIYRQFDLKKDELI